MFLFVAMELRDKGKNGFLLPPDQIIPTGNKFPMLRKVLHKNSILLGICWSILKNAVNDSSNFLGGNQQKYPLGPNKNVINFCQD
jgi:hypothetical protein